MAGKVPRAVASLIKVVSSNDIWVVVNRAENRHIWQIVIVIVQILQIARALAALATVILAE